MQFSAFPVTTAWLFYARQATQRPRMTTAARRAVSSRPSEQSPRSSLAPGVAVLALIGVVTRVRAPREGSEGVVFN
jgi:hypothetical protein